MSRLWISGIAGFLGSHLAQALKDEGHFVIGNDNLLCGDADNVPEGIYNWVIDCRNQKTMQTFMKDYNIDTLVHCAATAHEGLSSFSPSFVTKNIYESSVATFSAAIACGVKRIVFMSSMSRYGNGRGYGDGGEVVSHNSTHPNQGKWPCCPPFGEENLTAPVDPYGIAKVAAEDTLRNLCNTHGVSYSIIVPHNIIGLRQRYTDPFRNVASIMINRCLLSKPPVIYGDGSQTRSFSPVKDCIPPILRAIEGAADGEIINIGPDSGEITIEELAEKIMKLTNFTSDPIYVADRPNEVKHAYCSSDKARKLLGYKEQQSLDDCLKEMVDDIKVRGPKEFDYFAPIEIENGCPETWLKKLI